MVQVIFHFIFFFFDLINLYIFQLQQLQHQRQPVRLDQIVQLLHQRHHRIQAIQHHWPMLARQIKPQPAACFIRKVIPI